MAASERPEDGSGSGKRALHILVVDDDAEAAKTLAAALRHGGHVAGVAFSGSAAVLAAPANPPDVMLLELAMPHLDGYATVRLLLTRLAWRPLFIAVSEHDGEAHRQRSRAAGFDHHLVKPVGLPYLSAILEKGTRLLRPA